MGKLIDVVSLNGLYKLNGKFLAGDVDRAACFSESNSMIAQSVHQVGFAKTRSTVENKRVKRCAAGIIGNGHGGCAGKLIAVTFDKVFKSVPRTQIALNKRKLTQSDGGTDGLPRQRLCCSRGGLDGLGLKREFQLSGSRGRLVVCGNRVIKRRLFAEDVYNGFANQRVIVLLYPIIKKLAGNLDCQFAVSKLERDNRLEPRLKTQACHAPLDLFQATTPHHPRFNINPGCYINGRLNIHTEPRQIQY